MWTELIFFLGLCRSRFGKILPTKKKTVSYIPVKVIKKNSIK